MASFKDIPPFPDDVESHPLYVIDLNLLEKQDPNELERLWQACITLGFFYLKGFDDSVSDTMFKLATEMMQVPMTEKREYDQGTIQSYFGYKGFGDAIIDAKGTPDRNEFYNTAKDDILSYPNVVHRTNLPIINSNMDKLNKFVVQSHDIVTTVLKCLETKLQVEPGSLLNMHKIDDVSGDQVRFIKAPPKDPQRTAPNLGEHTDFGSVTVLHNRLGGLQVLVPGTTKWQYIKPLPGHAIINLGDALAMMTCGKLRSNMHRVNDAPGSQASYTRYSCVYFNRPSDETIIKPLANSPIVVEAAKENGKSLDEEFGSTKEWIARRVKYRRKEHFTGPEAFYNSRGTEHVNNPKFKNEPSSVPVH